MLDLRAYYLICDVIVSNQIEMNMLIDKCKSKKNITKKKIFLFRRWKTEQYIQQVSIESGEQKKNCNNGTLDREGKTREEEAVILRG